MARKAGLPVKQRSGPIIRTQYEGGGPEHRGPIDHLGIYYDTGERGIFMPDAKLPVQPTIADVRNPIGRKEKRHPGFRFDMWGQKGKG